MLQNNRHNKLVVSNIIYIQYQAILFLANSINYSTMLQIRKSLSDRVVNTKGIDT